MPKLENRTINVGQKLVDMVSVSLEFNTLSFSVSGGCLRIFTYSLVTDHYALIPTAYNV